MTAVDLRTRFRNIPKPDRDAHQDFAIRVWRALSWLERAESLAGLDYEGRFISCWIALNALNALYGRLDDHGKPWGDREALSTYVAQSWRLDNQQRLHRILGKRELHIIKLIGDKHLSIEFWNEGHPGERRVQREFKQASVTFRSRNRLPILKKLFERLYVMRVQVFHGASTKGSKLNRRTLQRSATILLDMLPIFIQIMLEAGLQHEWGRVCFSPAGGESSL